jgi:hypothetical protein
MCLRRARVTLKEHLHPRMGALVDAVRNMFLVTTPVFAQAAIQEPGARVPDGRCLERGRRGARFRLCGSAANKRDARLLARVSVAHSPCSCETADSCGTYAGISERILARSLALNANLLTREANLIVQRRARLTSIPQIAK